MREKEKGREGRRERGREDGQKERERGESREERREERERDLLHLSSHWRGRGFVGTQFNLVHSYLWRWKPMSQSGLNFSLIVLTLAFLLLKWKIDLIYQSKSDETQPPNPYLSPHKAFGNSLFLSFKFLKPFIVVLTSLFYNYLLVSHSRIFSYPRLFASRYLLLVFSSPKYLFKCSVHIGNAYFEAVWSIGLCAFLT